MNEEVKRVSQFWEEKFGSNVDSMYYENRLLEIDLTLQECDEILEEVGLGTGFISKESELENLLEDKRTLWNYVLALPDFISSYLDEPFCKALNQHATETISVIKMEDFSVNAGEDNQIGITESYYDPYLGEYKGNQTKTTFRFADFLGTGYSESANKDGWIVTKSGYVEEFARIFEAQYQGMREIVEEEFKKRGITDYETYIDNFSHQGEFDHRMDKPFLSFVSSVLDITVVKPMIESSIEKDLITGEDLSDLECQFKLVFAGVDMATLGGAMGATRLSEIGMKEALKATGKTVAVEFMGNTAVCGIGAIGQAFDWPVPVTIMLSLATGITVSCLGNKLVFEGEGFYREVPIEDVERIRQIEGGSTTGFKYEHNPMDNPKAAKDIIENPEAVYGFSPNPESTRIGKYAGKIDWTNFEQVAVARQTREAYHSVNEVMLQELYNSGYTAKDIAAKMVEERNMNRINSYINNGDLKGLEIVKQSNLETYGNELGMSLEQALEKYGSYEEIINATVRSNPGMDACTGLYDIYHGGK